MDFRNAPYEIEFRCQFKSDAEAYHILTFLQSSLKRNVTWVDTYYGLEVFKSGQVLRFSSIIRDNETRHYLGWKGVDIGTFANLRQELNEEIVRCANNSPIMRHFTGENRAYTVDEIVPALEKAGYHRFMSYKGQSFPGRFESLGINTKLMHCEELKWPLLVELEKIAATEAEARQCERELENISREYNLQEYLIKEEPGTLLYEKTFRR